MLELRWFTDRSESVLATPLVASAPMFVYRIAMLGWALWLALSIVRWLRWGFGAFGQGGFWRRPPPPVAPPAPPHRMPAPPNQQWPFQPGGPMSPPPGGAPPPAQGG